MESLKCACGRKISKYYYNSTIKRKMCPSCELKTIQIVSKENLGISINKSTKPKKSEKTRAMNRADEWFSRFIRLKHSVFISSGEPVCKCYTCGKLGHPKTFDCGHWQRRGYKTTRYNENNARPQCYQCNKIYQGKPEIFERNLINEIGEKKVKEIKDLPLIDTKDSQLFYREIAKKYRIKTNEIIKNSCAGKWW